LPQSFAGRDDLLFYVRQQTAYGLALSLLMTSGALFNERRSRRILAVLSKALERGEYLGGLLLGTLGISALYCFATAGAATWIALRFGLPVTPLWQFAGVLLCAMTLTATFAVLFSTFLHPLITTMVAAGAIAAQIVFEHAWAREYVTMLPASGLMRSLINFDLRSRPAVSPAVFFAIAEAAVLWLLATRIFALRDIAVAIE
jgi:ABC-type transport system involved in multi-copper enzyme maturation permease subunit